MMAKQGKELLLLLAGLGIACAFFCVTGIGCPIKWFTGISCAGCGMTRAVACALRLQFGRACYYHPLVFLMPLCALLFLFREKIPVRVQKRLTFTAAACFAVVYLVRLCHPNPVVSIEPENGMAAQIWKLLKGIAP